MKTIVLHKEIEPLPLESEEHFIDSHSGILNSTYKAATKSIFKNPDPDSVCAKRIDIRKYHYENISYEGTLLRLSLFTIIMVLILI